MKLGMLRSVLVFGAAGSLVLAAACDGDSDGGGGTSDATDTTGDPGGPGDVIEDPGVEDPGIAPDEGVEDPGQPDTPVEETKEEDTVVTPTEPNCLEITQCIFEACVGKTGADLDTCIAGADCGEAPTAEENAAVGAMVTCMDTNACSLDVLDHNHYECQRTNCLAEQVACTTQTFGETVCKNLGACENECADIIWDTLDLGCFGSCLAKGSETTVTDYWRMRLCLWESCYDTNDPDHVFLVTEFQDCERTSPFAATLCSDMIEHCDDPLQ